MQVTAVSTWFPTRRAPSRGSFVVRDLHAIARHHDVRLVHLVPPQDDDGTRRLVHEGIEVVRIPMAPSSPADVLRAARALPAALAGSDAVHTMAFSTLLPMAALRGRLRRAGIPWIHTEHWSALTTPETLPAAARAGLPALRRLLRGPDLVTAVCDFLARPLRSVRGDARPTEIVPCIVEPSAPAPRRSRADGELRLVSTGGLIERKDPLIAVATIAELVERGIDAHLLWLGEGPLREATLARAAELGVADRVSLPGTASGAEVREALAASDMFFGPTRADNFFVSAAEAIVAGRPVVLGATGGQGEYVTEEIGELVPVQHARAYADAICALDARARELPAEAIAAVIGDRFSSEHVGQGYARAYELAGAPRGDAPAHLTEGTMDHTMAEPAVEVVIACHTPRRRIDRAVASILDDPATAGLVRVRVIAHNTDPAALRAALRPEHRDRVVIDPLDDAIASPAGPFTRGIELGSTPLLAIMGSDDELEPGAIASWLAVQRATGADVVMPRLRLASSSGPVPTPPLGLVTALAALAGRPRIAAPLADRLCWRSAPLGLIRREAWERLGARLVPHLPVGEDVDAATLLALRARTAVDACGPAYVIGEDAEDRTTFVLHPLQRQLAFLPGVLRSEYTGPERREVALKCLRIHLFGAVHYRARAADWPLAEREELARLTAMLAAWAPGYDQDLSRAEARLLSACADPAVPVRELIAASRARRRHASPAAILPAHALRLLSPSAPPRLLAASLLASRLPRRS